jgi:hypothetical protein
MPSRMKQRHVFAGLVAAAAAMAGFTACSSNNSVGGTVGGPCGAPSGEVVLAYPAPNSTGIPDNFPGVIFGSTHGLGGLYQAVIVPAGSSVGQYFNTVAPAPSPLPTPNAPLANAVYEESSIPASYELPAHTQISVYLNDGNSNCTPSLQGTFTSK